MGLIVELKASLKSRTTDCCRLRTTNALAEECSSLTLARPPAIRSGQPRIRLLRLLEIGEVPEIILAVPPRPATFSLTLRRSRFARSGGGRFRLPGRPWHLDTHRLRRLRRG